MSGDAYGMSDGQPKPQAVLNESWPDQPRGLSRREPIDVQVRIVWAVDGEQWIDGRAVRWTGRHVYVEFDDRRIRTTGVWVAPADVVRR